jgi:RimJ/RimL family protein N-acetyltransferase
MNIPSLSTARLVLRPYQHSDFDDFAGLNADEQVRRHVGGPLTRERAAILFQKFSSECLPGNEVWAVFLKDSGEYLGHCWFVQQDTDFPELGILVARNYWRQGYGNEIAQTMLTYANNQANYRRIMATVDCDHVASIRLLESVGMKRERIEKDDEGIHYVYILEN